MRVLYACHAFWPYIGGMETISERLVAGLARDGFEVAVLTGRNDPRLPRDDEWAGVPVHRVDWWGALQARDAERVAAGRDEAITVAREWNPDLVHLAFTPLWASLVLSARLKRVAPLIVTVHGSWPLFFTQGAAASRRVLQEAAWVTACSQHALEAARSFEPVITGRSSLIVNGLDSPDPLMTLPRGDAPLVVAAARLEQEKGFDVLLQAFATVRRRVPRARLVLAGRGLAEDGLIALAGELGIAEAVEFRGWVPREEIEALLDRAAVVAVPSRIEGFGLTALETALRGRPVVASRVGGLREVVEDGVTGVLVPPEDPDALAAELVALLGDPDRAERLGRAARERAELHFGEEHHLRAYEALYQRLVSPRSNTADTIAG